ncbi:beta-lactamase family protein [Flavobacteriaceae bacterium TP-CH-4]|uniref:Beta-lactamase family protein n=1 Tax=Pelagihabitans pacificus TaxID=2696054 RepID=A0A967AVL6_9FLAO|nr:serine hydrolase domain-containing protein [Pelagihabitans pacificus]NHF60774.1 beta-lactamase family protein [Pelagihabitans pacificus]
MNKYFLLFFLSVHPLVLGAQTTVAANYQDVSRGLVTRAQADSIFQKIKQFPPETEVAIALVENGKARFYGIKRQGDSVITINNQQRVFEIGSITKIFTATLLADFVINQQVQLEDPINSYLKFPLKANAEISFESLANHTSGLPRLPTNLKLSFESRNNPYASYDETKLTEYLTEMMVLDEKREVSYSNLGAGLLGYTLGKMGKTSYQKLVRDSIFSMYGMEHTTTNRGDVESLLVKGRNGGTVVPNWDLAILVGAGGILSNVHDLSKFVLAQFDPTQKALALTREKTVSVNETTDVGLGWFMNRPGQYPGTIHFHNGGTGGYTAAMMIDLEKQNGVVLLTNISAFSPDMGKIEELGLALMQTLTP